jgi:hypothetical protein
MPPVAPDGNAGGKLAGAPPVLTEDGMPALTEEGMPVLTEEGMPALTEEGMPALVLVPEPGLLPPVGGRLAGIRLLAFASAFSFHRSAPGTVVGRLLELELLALLGR